MIADPILLVKPAEEAGISVPLDVDHYDEKDYPHWDVFCAMQLGSSMPDWSCHFHNAKVISQIDGAEIRQITADEIIERGFQIGYAPV